MKLFQTLAQKTSSPFTTGKQGFLPSPLQGQGRGEVTPFLNSL